ncbi:MAG: nicotinate (nicotinamide) nucleotide adenylyltransferase [Armatimonadetes bacterium]|nr:nicotinate (nicotinamide) nucleotide adenylyltransferase [Armatimonadota bacterium]
MEVKRRIGILGGTFDPPHLGHLQLAQAAKDSLQLDEVLFVPAHRNPLKKAKPGASAADRLAMTQLLVAGHPDFAVSDLEIQRKGQSYAIITLGELQAVMPGDYWFILGSDALGTLKDWKDPEKLLRHCRIAVASRAPHRTDEAIGRIPEEFRGVIDMIDMPENPVSSSELRDALERRLPVNRYLPESVVKYIRDKKLYWS